MFTRKYLCWKIMYRVVSNRKILHWKNKYKEIYVLENNAQEKICTGKFSIGKLCTGKCVHEKICRVISNRKSVYQKNVYKDLYALENFVEGKICTRKNVYRVIYKIKTLYWKKV